jgi:hypothetical protein
MTTVPNKNKVEFTIAGLASVLFVTVLVSGIITWGLISSLAAPKSKYDESVSEINNALNHIEDATTGLDNYASYQNSKIDEMNEAIQVDLDEIGGRLTDDEAVLDTKAASADLDNFKSTVNSDLSSLKTTVDTKASTSDLVTLKTTVDAKASASDLSTLETTVDDQADDIETLTASVEEITMVIPSGIIDANYDFDRYIWTADGDYEVTGITFVQSVKESTNTSTTLMIRKVPSGTSLTSGSSLLSSAVNLKSGVTANTALGATLTSTSSYLELEEDDSLALDFTNEITEYLGCVTITLKRI